MYDSSLERDTSAIKERQAVITTPKRSEYALELLDDGENLGIVLVFGHGAHAVLGDVLDGRHHLGARVTKTKRKRKETTMTRSKEQHHHNTHSCERNALLLRKT